jgi:predicted  nucleic acid-binding Zn-ribbon protein
MTDEVEATLRESQAVIARAEALLKEAGEAMERGEKLLADNNVSAEALHAFIEKQSAEGRAEFEKEVQAVREEIERDLPKQEATARSVRVRPSRQMI